MTRETKRAATGAHSSSDRPLIGHVTDAIAANTRNMGTGPRAGPLIVLITRTAATSATATTESCDVRTPARRPRRSRGPKWNCSRRSAIRVLVVTGSIAVGARRGTLVEQLSILRHRRVVLRTAEIKTRQKVDSLGLRRRRPEVLSAKGANRKSGRVPSRVQTATREPFEMPGGAGFDDRDEPKE